MSDFPPGFRILHRGQVYQPIGLREHTTAKGQTITLIDWRTDCPECGVLVSTPLRWNGAPVRRCQACKAPGKRVASLCITR